MHISGFTLHPYNNNNNYYYCYYYYYIYNYNIIRYVCLLSQAFLPGTSLEPAVIPTAQASSFTYSTFRFIIIIIIIFN